MTTKRQAAALDERVIADRIRNVLAAMVRTDPDTLTDGMRLFADLGLDSTSALELLMLIEDDLGVRIDADSLEHRHLETIGSLAGYFVAQMGR
jgi:acyl carrier protein